MMTVDTRVSRRPTLYTPCGTQQVTWKTVLPGSPGASCPAPLESEGKEWMGSQPPIRPCVLKFLDRVDAGQLSERGRRTCRLIFSPGDISVMLQMSSNKTKWSIVVRAALAVNCNCLLRLYTMIYNIHRNTPVN